MNAPRSLLLNLLCAISIASSINACSCGEDPSGGKKDGNNTADFGPGDSGDDDVPDLGPKDTGDDGGSDGGNDGGDVGDTGGDTGVRDGGADPNNPNNDMIDTDCDGLSDAYEFSTVYPGGERTDPNNPDSDGDGIPDGIEAGVTAAVTGSGCPAIADADPNTRTSPVNDDNDGDGILDGLEDANHNGAVDANETNPNARDSDGDQLPDGVEDANQNGTQDAGETNPRTRDTDADGIADGVEDENRNGQRDAGETDPLDADTDNDGVPDGTEDTNHDGNRQPNETNPLDTDTDCDGLSDGAEINQYNTSPLLDDSDGDGINDGVEAGVTQIPIAGSSCPAGQPTDQDPNTVTDPNDPDSDGDGLPDGVEDANQNGRVDPGESDPGDEDSDNDGVDDGTEVLIGSDPTNPNDPAANTGTGINLICADNNLRVVDFHVGGASAGGQPAWTLATEQSFAYLPIAVNAPGSGIEVAVIDDTTNNVAGFVLRMPLLTGPATSDGQRAALDARISAAAAGEQLSLIARISPRNITSHDGFETAVSAIFDTTVSGAQANTSSVRNRFLRMITNLDNAMLPGLPGTTGGAAAAYVFSYQILLRTNPQELIVVGALLRSNIYDLVTDNRSFIVNDLTNGTALALANARVDKECDPFESEGGSVADFIWMADISGSTDDDRGRIATAGGVVFDALTQNGIDFRMGVVPHINNSLRPGGGTTPGQLRSGFTRDMATFVADLQNSTGSDGCEFGLTAAHEAISRALPRTAVGAAENTTRLRAEAQLAVVYISDEHAQEVTESQCGHDPGGAACSTGIVDYYSTGDDNICAVTLTAANQTCVNNQVQQYINRLNNNSGIAFAQIIVPAGSPTVCTGYACPNGQPANEPSIGYVEVVNATGGAFYSPCQDNPGPALQAIVDAISGAASQYQLTGAPISATLKVGVINIGTGGNGSTDIVPRDKDNGFDYDPASNSIFFRGSTYRPQTNDLVVVSYRVWEPPNPPCGGACLPNQTCDPNLDVCVCDAAICNTSCGPNETCNADCSCSCAPDCNSNCGGNTTCNSTTCECECPADCGGCPTGTTCNPANCACECDSDCGGACSGNLECNTGACNCQCPSDCGGTCAQGTVCNTSLCVCTCPAGCDDTCPGNASCDPTNSCACECPNDCGGCPDNTACNPTSCACECPANCEATQGCQNREVCDPNQGCGCFCPSDCGGCAANETCDQINCRCVPIV
jgi:hypothetical protein